MEYEDNQAVASRKEEDFVLNLYTNFLFQCVGKVSLDEWHCDKHFVEHYSVSG